MRMGGGVDPVTSDLCATYIYVEKRLERQGGPTLHKPSGVAITKLMRRTFSPVRVVRMRIGDGHTTGMV